MLKGYGGKNKERKHKMLTFMIIPHSTSKPIRVDISKNFIAALFFIFTGIIGWSGFVIHKQVDYWAMKAENKILAKETDYFAQEMLQARQMADNLREMERELRKLLGLKEKNKIIKYGGPTIADLERVTKYLEGRELSITPYEFKKHLSALEDETKDLEFSFGRVRQYIKEKQSLWESTPCMWPVRGRITSGFGPRIHPIKKRKEIHLAIDIGARRGMPIKAPADGEVVLSGWHSGYGKLVVIRHGHGYMTRYGHCSKLLVKAGQNVKRGQEIALVGSTGCATASHLHYEVWKSGKAQNPKRYLTEAILK
ncbi:MAG: peptidoglycan DD-metalloendopeptidase family protein [Elusimicrobia bacterium]|nr:peptidoglycan DD-metalloendopeptidase family protein [Elusimicrobiota bacterium]